MSSSRAPVRHPVASPVVLPETFPFGVEFQKALFRLITEDVSFATAAMPYLEPGFFENEVLVWGYNYMVDYKAKYNAVPTVQVMLEDMRHLDPQVQELYRLTLQQVVQADLSAEAWLRDKVLDFIKRNLFVRAFKDSRKKYNLGQVGEAYDVMMRAMERITTMDWTPPDRSFFFDEFTQRFARRLSEDPALDTISTGIPELDHVLGGGLSIGELGIWVAYAKRGKSTMLVNQGVQAVRRGNHKTLHLVFEGSRKQVEARYDTVFAQESYQRVRSSDFSSRETFERMQFDYRMYSRKLVVRGFTDEWNYTCQNIWDEMKELKRLYNWKPELLVVDYGDLLRGRGEFRSETEHQTAAFRDLKSLANRGYAVWTASQAQRPKKDVDMDEELLQSRKIADAYAKVRVADFLGTLNQTREERVNHQMRILAEMYRDNEAGRVILVKADFDKMTISAIRDGSGVLPSPVINIPLGYTVPQQRKAPI